jgi:nucleotide-binding universal stress UspA family protein
MKSTNSATLPMILVPLDGSPVAEHAITVAAALARRTGARLHLVTAVEHLSVLASGEEPMTARELDQELREFTLGYLKSQAEALGITHGLEVGYSVLDGPPAGVLATFAATHHARVIVMTTHGHSGFNRLWLGSVADRLLRRVTVPVLLLRAKDAHLTTEFRHILIALDGQPEGEGVLEPAIELGSLFPDARFTLMQVVEPPIPLITRMAMQPAKLRSHWHEIQENSARSHLERLANGMRARGLQVETQVISARGVGEQILDLAAAIGADLIVVGTHGARGMERLLLGSVADKVIRGATHQVLVIPTRKDAERSEPHPGAAESSAEPAHLGDRALHPGAVVG